MIINLSKKYDYPGTQRARDDVPNGHADRGFPAVIGTVTGLRHIALKCMAAELLKIKALSEASWRARRAPMLHEAGDLDVALPKSRNRGEPSRLHIPSLYASSPFERDFAFLLDWGLVSTLSFSTPNIIRYSESDGKRHDTFISVLQRARLGARNHQTPVPR